MNTGAQRGPVALRSGEVRLLGLFRIITGFLFVCHGVVKLFGGIGEDPLPIGTWPHWWAGLIELGAGTLVGIGVLIRPAALFCSGTMAYAYFTEHQGRGLLPIQNDGEPAVLYCWAFLAIAILAPTALSLRNIAPLRPTARGNNRGDRPSTSHP